MTVSDFELAQHIIKDICSRAQVLFVNVPISFQEKKDGYLYISNSKNVCHTIYKIVQEYIKNDIAILGKSLFQNQQEKEDFLLNLATSLRAVQYSRHKFYKEDEKSFSKRLYQIPIIWTILKDIICPLYKISLCNIKIIIGNNYKVDIAKFCDKKYLNIEESFIFLNQIENGPVLYALLFIEVLKFYELDPVAVLLDIFESEIFDKFDGLLTMAYNSNETDKKVFLNTLMNVSRIGKPINIKKAQTLYPEMQNNFWFLGLIENLLEPTRGSDWSTTRDLQPMVDEFWNKVEAFKQSKKSKTVTFNELLELKRAERPIVGDKNMTLQGLLSSDRIW